VMIEKNLSLFRDKANLGIYILKRVREGCFHNLM
jgi:hypothetical protein